jgi:predicted house-cleaning noncanonical NTP pyrophosphatase (MazG superfamily)
MGFRDKDREALERLENKKYCNVAAAIGFTVGAVAIGSSRKGGGAPDPNPGMIASAESSEKVGMRSLDLQEDYMKWSKSYYDDLKPTIQKLADIEYDIAVANKNRADDYAKYEKETFRPLEERLVKEAEEYNTEANREKLASQAAADVQQSYGVAQQQNARALTRMGVNPNAARFGVLNNQLALRQAADTAGAMTKARNDAEAMGFARRMDAAGLGRNLAPNASTAYGVSLNASGQAGDSAMRAGNFMSGAYGQGSNMLGQATSAFGTAGNIYGQDFNARMQGYNAQQASRGAMMQGLGSAFGMWAGGGFKMPGAADGGQARGLRKRGTVSGPGGPVDDLVPAMLSDGEYVLPADTVKKVGVKKLDRLVKDTHTPAAEQRARKKRGMRGKKK